MNQLVSTAQPGHPSGSPSRTQQYLTFLVDTEEYGVEIGRVQEVRGFTPITKIPNAPAYVKGVMNLRGAVVPVVGLREAFGMQPAPYDKFSVIAVVALGTRLVGLLIDAVSEVIDFDLADMDLVPELAARVDTSFIAGMGRAGDRFIIVLEIEKVVSGLDLAAASLGADIAPTETTNQSNGRE